MYQLFGSGGSRLVARLQLARWRLFRLRDLDAFRLVVSGRQRMGLTRSGEEHERGGEHEVGGVSSMHVHHLFLVGRTSSAKGRLITARVCSQKLRTSIVLR